MPPTASAALLAAAPAELSLGCSQAEALLLRTAAHAALADAQVVSGTASAARRSLRRAHLGLQRAMMPGGGGGTSSSGMKRGCGVGVQGTWAAGQLGCVQASPLALLASTSVGRPLLQLLGRLQCRAKAPNLSGCSKPSASLARWAAGVAEGFASGATPQCAGHARAVMEEVLQSDREQVRIVEVGAVAGAGCGLWAALQLRRLGRAAASGAEVLLLPRLPVVASQLDALIAALGVGAIARVLRLGEGDIAAHSKAAEICRALETDSQDGCMRRMPPPLDVVVPAGDVDLLLVGEGFAGRELDVLRGAGDLFNLWEVRAVVLRLRPRSVAFPSSDPLSVYEWLVWHGRFVSPTGPRPEALATVGEAERAVAGAGDAGLEVLSLPLAPRMRHRPPDLPHHEESGRRRRSCSGGRCCLRFDQGQRSNSWAAVDSEVLVANLRRAAGLRGGLHNIGAVLSAAAFGHGAVLAGRLLAAEGVGALFCSQPEEALRLRLSAPPRTRVVLLGQVADRATFCSLVQARVELAVWSRRWLCRVQRWHCGGPAERGPLLHLSIDTGLGREGLRPGDVLGAAWRVLRPGRLRRRPGALARAAPWRLAGVYTKWCCPEDPEMMAAARRTFAAAAHGVQRLLGPWRGRRGTSRSRRLLLHVGGLGLSAPTGRGWPWRWMLRIGAGLFGAPMLSGSRSALTWKSTLSAVRDVPAGSPLGYCPPDVDCGERHVVPAGEEASASRKLGVIPVGFSEFQGSAVKRVADGMTLEVLSSGASTTVVLLPAAGAEFAVGDEVELCSGCSQEMLPLAVPRVLVSHDEMMVAEVCADWLVS